MRMWITFGFTALLAFGLSATISYFWHQYRISTTEEGSLPSKRTEEMALEEEPRSIPKPGSVTKTTAGATGSARPAVRPSYSPEAEEAAQLAQKYRDGLREVADQKKQLEARQKQLDLIFQDIRTERSSIEDLRRELSNQLKAAEEERTALDRKLQEIQEQQQVTTKKEKDLEKTLTSVQGTEEKNLKREAEIFGTMEPASAAKILQQMVKEDKLDTAVSLLGMMKERKAAQVLAELNDSSMATQLLEKLKRLKKATPPKPAGQS